MLCPETKGAGFWTAPPAAMKIMVGYVWGHIILGGECTTLDLAEVFSFADDGHPKNHAASIIEFLSLLRWVHFVRPIFTLAAGPVVVSEANNSTYPFHYVKPELGRNLGDNAPKLCILANAFMEMQKHSIIGLISSHFRHIQQYCFQNPVPCTTIPYILSIWICYYTYHTYSLNSYYRYLRKPYVLP